MKSRFWLIFFLVWTPVAILAGWWLWHARAGEPPVVLAGIERDAGVWGELFHRNFYPLYAWVLLAPFVFFLCRQFPLGIGRWRIVLPVLVIAAACFVLLGTVLSRQIARNTPSLLYVDSPVATSLERSEFADELVELFKAGLANSETPPPTIRRLENGGFEIRSMTLESKPIQIPVAVSTELKIDLEVVPPGALEESIRRAVVVATENELAMMVTAAAGAAKNNEAAATTPRVEKPQAPMVLTAGLQLGGFILLAIVGHAVVYFRRFREREQHSLRLDQELAEARLRNLKSQLQPHFLFNSLNGISAHIHDEPDQAVDMIGHLGDLLRHSLDHGREISVIQLRDELTILDHYLELQSMRFGERLKISRDLAVETLELEIPPFVLQPLAENVIRHAVETSPEPRHLVIGSRLDGDYLKLWIKDDGPGPEGESTNPGTGTGLNNLKERLETLYPGCHSLQIEAGENGIGTVVTLKLPIEGGGKAAAK